MVISVEGAFFRMFFTSLKIVTLTYLEVKHYLQRKQYISYLLLIEEVSNKKITFFI